MANSAHSSAIHHVSRRIIERETAGSDDPARVAEGVARALHHVQGLFSNVIGPGGFEGVITRSVHLARGGCPWLERTHVTLTPTLTLGELATTAQREGAEEVKAGATLLLETFLALLATFIGEELTLSLLRGRGEDSPGAAQEDRADDPE